MLKLHAVVVTKIILTLSIFYIGWWGLGVLGLGSLVFNLLMLIKTDELQKIEPKTFWAITIFPLTIFVVFILLNVLDKQHEQV